MKTIVIGCALVMVASFSQQNSAPAAPGPTMEDAIQRIVRDFQGIVGVAAIDLTTREQIGINADARFPTASTIKTAVMLEAYHQAADGTLPFTTALTLRESEKVGGSGVLRDLHDGLTLTVADLVHLMMVLSDNTATNMLIARLGTARIERRLEGYGLRDTHLFRPTFRDGRADLLPELEREFGFGMTTPREMAKLLALVGDGRAVDASASEAMLATLRRQQDRAMIPRLLPSDDGLEIGNKTGSDQEKQAGANGVRGHVRADVAIVTGPKNLRYVIAIYARQIQDTRWTIENEALVTGARISRLVYDHFSRR